MYTLDTAVGSTTAVRQREPGRITWLLVAPLFLWVAAFVIAPTLIMLVYSFCERGTLGGVVFNFTLANYAAVFDPTYLQIVVRSIFFAGLTTAICLAMGYPVAYFIGRASEKSRNLLLMMVMVLSPIAYTPEMVPASLRPVLILNPLAYFIVAYQNTLILGRLPSLGNVVVMLVLSLH